MTFTHLKSFRDDDVVAPPPIVSLDTTWSNNDCENGSAESNKEGSWTHWCPKPFGVNRVEACVYGYHCQSNQQQHYSMTFQQAIGTSGGRGQDCTVLQQQECVNHTQTKTQITSMSLHPQQHCHNQTHDHHQQQLAFLDHQSTFFETSVLGDDKENSNQNYATSQGDIRKTGDSKSACFGMKKADLLHFNKMNAVSTKVTTNEENRDGYCNFNCTVYVIDDKVRGDRGPEITEVAPQSDDPTDDIIGNVSADTSISTQYNKSQADTKSMTNISTKQGKEPTGTEWLVKDFPDPSSVSASSGAIHQRSPDIEECQCTAPKKHIPLFPASTQENMMREFCSPCFSFNDLLSVSLATTAANCKNYISKFNDTVQTLLDCQLSSFSNETPWSIYGWPTPSKSPISVEQESNIVSLDSFSDQARVMKSLNNETTTAVEPFDSLVEYQSMIEETSIKESENIQQLAERCEDLLREIFHKFQTGKHRFQPNESCYYSVIFAYKRARMPQEAERIFRLMLTDFDQGNLSAEPSARILSNLLRAWQKSKDLEAPQHCERILQEMYNFGDSQRFPQCKPTVRVVTTAIHTWAESGQLDAADHAARIFRQMKTRFLNGDDTLRPSCLCYAVLLKIFVDQVMIDKAESLFWEMTEEYLDGNNAVKPRIRDLNMILSLYIRSKMEEATERAECVVARFLELHDKHLLTVSPDAYTCLWINLLLENHGACDALDKSQYPSLNWLLLRFPSLRGKIARPTTTTMTGTIEWLVMRGDRDTADRILHFMLDECMAGNNSVVPEYRFFDLVVSAFAGPICQKWKHRVDTRSAESILRRVWLLSESSKPHSYLRPRLSTFEILIIANAEGNNAKRADDLLWKLVENKIAYPPQDLLEAVEQAWKASRHPDKQRQLSKVQCYKTKLYENGCVGCSKKI